MDLLQETKQLLEERRKSETLEQIAKGAGINYWWMRSFAARKINEPGYLKLSKLHSYLSSDASKAA